MTYRADNLLVAQGGCSRPVHPPVAHGVVSPQKKTKKSHFTTTTTPRRISYVGIRKIRTGAEKILSQFSFNDGTERKASSWQGSTLLLPRKIHPAKDVAAALVNPEAY